jgi:hypothetical protein
MEITNSLLCVRRLSIATITLMLSAAAAAQDAYPSKPVRVLVGLAPGGATDLQTRLFAQKLTETFNRPFVVENRPGAGGTVAYAQLAKSPPDGYTLMGITSGFTITPHIYKKLPYDPAKDFAPIALVVQAPFVLAVHPSLPAKSVRDLLSLAKAKPGALNCASAGLGSSTHMAFELFKALAGVKNHARAVQGHRPGAGGCHRRPGAHALRQRAFDAHARERRAPARARRDDGAALEGAAGAADDCRIGRALATRTARGTAGSHPPAYRPRS